MLNARENSHCNKYYFVEAFSEKWDDSFIDIKVDLNDISRYIGMLEFRFMLCKVNIYLKKSSHVTCFWHPIYVVLNVFLNKELEYISSCNVVFLSLLSTLFLIIIF